MRVINGLVSQGIEVITDRTHLVHVSGHPRVAELEDMIGWVRPQNPDSRCTASRCTWPSMPRSRAASASARWFCAATASSSGWRPAHPEKSTRCRPDGSTRTARCWSAPRSAPSPTAAGSDFAGVVSIALAISERGELVADPAVTLTGIPEADAQGRRIEDIAYDAALEAFESMPRARRRDPEAVTEAVRRAIRAAVARRGTRSPPVTCMCSRCSLCQPGPQERTMIGRLNHVAIAVRDIAKAANVYRETLGAEVSERSAAAGPRRDHGLHHAAEHQDRAARAARRTTRRSRNSSSAIRTAAFTTSATRSTTSAPRATSSRRRARACSATASRRSAPMASRCCSCTPRISAARWSRSSRRDDPKSNTAALGGASEPYSTAN